MSLLFLPIAALVTVTIAALLFRYALVRAFQRWTRDWNEGRLVVRAIRVPSIFWCVVLGQFVALQMVELQPRLAGQIQTVLELAIILSVTITAASVLGSLVAAASERHALAVGVTAPDHVERVLVEEATAAVGQVPRLLGDPPPAARLIPGFGDYSLDFTLACQAHSFVDQFTIQHELRKRILKRLRAEDIAMPSPPMMRPARS